MPGEFEFAVAGRCWSQLDRQNPIEGKAREPALVWATRRPV